MIDAPVERVTDRNLARATRIHSITWQEHYRFRNAILRALRPFGTVGPSGEALITDEPDGPPADKWPLEAVEPEYWVMDDQWLDDRLWLRVETDAAHMTEGALDSLLKVTSNWKGATIAVALGEEAKGYLVIATGRVFVQGRLFPRTCRTARDVIARCRDVAEKLGDRWRRRTSE